MNVFGHIRAKIEPEAVKLEDALTSGAFTTMEDYREAVGKLSSYKEIRVLLSEAESAMEEDDNE